MKKKMKMKIHHFEKIESYKHKYAKMLLRFWLLNGFDRIDIEEPVYLNGIILFIPDITCINVDSIVIYEVVHKNQLDAYKLNEMQKYYWNMQLPVIVYEISSEWILSQIRKPKKINAIKMIDFTTEELDF